MGRKKKHEESVAISVRLPTVLKKLLEERAAAEDSSQNDLVIKAVFWHVRPPPLERLSPEYAAVREAMASVIEESWREQAAMKPTDWVGRRGEVCVQVAPRITSLANPAFAIDENGMVTTKKGKLLYEGSESIGSETFVVLASVHGAGKRTQYDPVILNAREIVSIHPTPDAFA